MNTLKKLTLVLLLALTPATLYAADLSVTAVSIASTETVTRQVQFGESTSSNLLGAVYQKASDGKYYLCDADDPNNIPGALASGVVIAGAGADAYGLIALRGPVNVTLTSGTLDTTTAFFTSDTAGGVRPIADLDSDDYVCFLGMATSGTVFDVSIKKFGHQLP